MTLKALLTIILTSLLIISCNKKSETPTPAEKSSLSEFSVDPNFYIATKMENTILISKIIKEAVQKASTKYQNDPKKIYVKQYEVLKKHVDLYPKILNFDYEISLLYLTLSSHLKEENDANKAANALIANFSQNITKDKICIDLHRLGSSKSVNLELLKSVADKCSKENSSSAYLADYLIIVLQLRGKEVFEKEFNELVKLHPKLKKDKDAIITIGLGTK